MESKNIIWILKFFLTLLAAVLIFKQITIQKPSNIKDAWCFPYSLIKQKKLAIYCNPIKNHKASLVRIFDLNEQPVDSFIINLDKKPVIKNLEWLNGYTYTNFTTYTSKLKPGLYHIEDKATFCITDTTAHYLIVVPHLSYIASSNYGGGSFYQPLKDYKTVSDTLFNKVTKTPYYLSVLRPCIKINNFKILYEVIKSEFKNSSIGFISDLDLFTTYKAKTWQKLIFYGNFSFMTPELAVGINKHLQQNGKVLIAASSIMLNKTNYLQNKHQIIFYGSCSNLSRALDSTYTAIPFNDNCSNLKNYSVIGGDYFFADKAIQNYFEYSSELKEMLPNTDKLFFNSTYYNGIPLKNKFTPNYQLTKTDSGKILAYIPCKYNNKLGYGTIGVLYKKKGVIIFLPSDRWFEDDNQQIPWVNTLTKKLIKNYFY